MLVYAAAGGVGTAAIQVARALGARVVAAVGSAEKLDVCRELGADGGVRLRRAPDDLRVDVVVDPVGGELFEAAVARLRPLGQLVAIGSAGGLVAGDCSRRSSSGRNVGVQGFYLGRLLRLAPDVVAAAHVGELLELWQTGAIRPLVGAELPLDEVEHAHELVESRAQRRQGGARSREGAGHGRPRRDRLARSARCSTTRVALDLPEFDVGDAEAWRALEGEFDAAFLNAGIGIGYADAGGADRRASTGGSSRANLDGVVFGTRELARAADAERRLDRRDRVARRADGDAVRSRLHARRSTRSSAACAAPRRGLAARGIRINALCPGFTDTPIVRDELRDNPIAPLMEPSFVAEAALRVARPTRRRAARGSCSRTASCRSASRACRGRDEPSRRASRGASSRRPTRTSGTRSRYRGIEQGDGRAVIEWDATPEYCFHAPSGPIVHGGMVAALLDTAMGGACWTLMAEDEDFLTADLRTEFHRSARPGTLRAEGHVVQRNRRVVFCAAELFQDGELVASAALHADRAPDGLIQSLRPPRFVARSARRAG